jgi:hypothetical protein
MSLMAISWDFPFKQRLAGLTLLCLPQEAAPWLARTLKSAPAEHLASATVADQHSLFSDASMISQPMVHKINFCCFLELQILSVARYGYYRYQCHRILNHFLIATSQPVLRIRIRDPVLFYPLDQGSGIFFLWDFLKNPCSLIFY